MDSFLRHTAASILQTMDWKQLSRTTLVLPSHRAGLVLKDELLRLQQASHTKAVWAPTVQTLPQLQDTLSPLFAEDELFTVVRLYKHYRLVAEDPMPLELFYGWGRQMIADFTNIDASMPASEVTNFFANTVAAHELSEWQLDTETEARLRSLISSEKGKTNAPAQSIRAHYEQLWQHLYTFYQALHAEMEAEQKGYPGMRQRAVIAHWEDEKIQQQIAGRTFIFVGFNYLLPVERELMMRLRDAGQAMFFWDYVRDFETNEKAFSFAQHNSQLLGDNGERRLASGERKALSIIECSSRASQAQYVHRWLQEAYTQKGQKVGVVICDETMLEPVIYTLPSLTPEGESEPQAVNITKGFPLRNTAVYARVLAWLNDSSRGDANSPVQPSIIDELLAELFPVIEESAPETETPSPLSWQELLILESEYQVRTLANKIRLLLTEGLGDVPFTLKLLRLLMRRMMENVTMPFHGEPITDVQIMGVLETRLLDFDRLLILNVEEGVIPQRQADESFIPYYLRKAYSMQTSDERATVYAYNFFRLLSRAGHTTLLYTSAQSAEGGKGMSRFLTQILYSPEFEVTRGNLEEASVLSAQQTFEWPSTVSLGSLLHTENGIVMNAEGKPYRISPSALNTYIACPRSFYLQYILGLRPKEEEDILFGPAEMGSFVHYAMEYIYRVCMHCDGNEPTPVLPEAIEAVLNDEAKMQAALDYAYEQMNKEAEKNYIPAHHSGENVIIKGYIRNILERDCADARVGLKIYLLEKERSFAVPIDSIGQVQTGGIIDRLDIYGAPGNECLRIVDYKSGSYNDTTHAKRMSASWEELMESPDKSYLRQTLIYSQAVQIHDKTGLPIEPNLFFCRRKLTEITTTLEVNGETVHDYRTIRKPFFEAIQTKIAQILQASQFPPCEEDQCPSFCPFFTLCARKTKEF